LVSPATDILAIVMPMGNTNFSDVTDVYKGIEIYGKIVVDSLGLFWYFRSLIRPEQGSGGNID